MSAEPAVPNGDSGRSRLCCPLCDWRTDWLTPDEQERVGTLYAGHALAQHVTAPTWEQEPTE